MYTSKYQKARRSPQHVILHFVLNKVLMCFCRCPRFEVGDGACFWQPAGFVWHLIVGFCRIGFSTCTYNVDVQCIVQCIFKLRLLQYQQFCFYRRQAFFHWLTANIKKAGIQPQTTGHAVSLTCVHCTILVLYISLLNTCLATWIHTIYFNRKAMLMASAPVTPVNPNW